MHVCRRKSCELTTMTHVSKESLADTIERVSEFFGPSGQDLSLLVETSMPLLTLQSEQADLTSYRREHLHHVRFQCMWCGWENA